MENNDKKYRTKDDKQFKRSSEVYSQNKYPCKHCGHKQLIPKIMEKNLCDWCGFWVFKNEKDEFKYRMDEQIKRRMFNEK